MQSKVAEIKLIFHCVCIWWWLETGLLGVSPYVIAEIAKWTLWYLNYIAISLLHRPFKFEW